MRYATGKCEHGVSANDGRYAGAWAAPYSKCECCGTIYFYIDSGWTTPKGSGGRSFSKDRCAECGGVYTEYGVQP